jgi:hypothetical protein
MIKDLEVLTVSSRIRGIKRTILNVTHSAQDAVFVLQLCKSEANQGTLCALSSYPLAHGHGIFRVRAAPVPVFQSPCRVLQGSSPALPVFVYLGDTL